MELIGFDFAVNCSILQLIVKIKSTFQLITILVLTATFDFSYFNLNSEIICLILHGVLI